TTAINEYIVMEGDDVKLVYKSNGSVGIYRVEDSNHIIVRNGSLEGNPMIYDDWFTEVSSSMNITLFEEFCSFPPSVYMEELQVMISPSVNTMTDSGNITFTCSSNAGPLNNVTWKITLEFPKSSISLLVNCDRLIFGLDTPIHIDNTSIYAECLGVIRSQSADAKAVLFLQAYILGSQMDLISYLYFAFFFAFVVVVLCLMIYCCYETKKSLINSQNQYTLNVSGNEHQPNESPEHYQQITYKEKEDEEHIEIPGDLQFIYDKECYLVPSQNIATDTQHVVMN
ncbi:hypothetical protein BSL78_13337, partial [Apostichopus japonicus]